MEYLWIAARELLRVNQSSHYCYVCLSLTFYNKKDDDCTQHFCPNGQVCENTRTGPICKCPRGYEKDARSNHCVGKIIKMKFLQFS